MKTKDEEIAELKKQVAELKNAVSVLSSFAPKLSVCVKCGCLYPKGYICDCGHDNSTNR